MAKLQFAPGENQLATARFSPSILLFWLRVKLFITNVRFIARQSNTILGLIPFGRAEIAVPLANVAATATSVKFHFARLILALLCLLFGTSGITDRFEIPLIVLGIIFALNIVDAQLAIQNNAGMTIGVRVSVLEKRRLDAFRNKINEQLFADRVGLRHQESIYQQQTHHNQMLDVQQQQLAHQALLNQTLLGQGNTAAPQTGPLDPNNPQTQPFGQLQQYADPPQMQAYGQPQQPQYGDPSQPQPYGQQQSPYGQPPA